MWTIQFKHVLAQKVIAFIRLSLINNWCNMISNAKVDIQITKLIHIET